MQSTTLSRASSSHSIPLQKRKSWRQLSYLPGLLIFTLSVFLSESVSIVAAQTIPERDVWPNQVMVLFEEGFEPASGAGKTGLVIFDAAGRTYGVNSVMPAFPTLNVAAAKRGLTPSGRMLQRVFTVHFGAGFDPEDVSAALARDPHVIFAEPRFIQRIAENTHARPTTPDDPFFSLQTHLARLQLPEAWDVVKSEQGSVLIAIVDGGTDWRHDDLFANVWTNPDEVDGNGIDDDLNGFIDDIHGWNFTNDSPDPTGLTTTPLSAAHGTSVAGAAAAVSDNGLGVTGSSWNATFMAVNVSCVTEDTGICFSLSGVRYAALKGADVINASWGGGTRSETGQLVYNEARELGALVIAAGGNDGTNNDTTPFYPAGYDGVLSVGGTAKNSDLVVFNYGRTMDVFAPGIQINTTSQDNQYTSVSGTSFSAPLVTGIAALVKTWNPAFSVDELREQLRVTSDAIDDANPNLNGLLGRGRINAFRAVSESGSPAIRLTDWSFEDEDGNLDIRSGERVEITATFTNFLADASNLILELDSDDSFISFPSPPVMVGGLASGASVTVTLEFETAPNTPDNYALVIYTRATAGTYVDTADVIRLSANEAAIANHNSGALQVSITDECNIGYLEYQAQSPGVGFVARDAQNNARDLLFEGGLLVATGPDAVSDCVRGLTDGPIQNEDFVLKSGTFLEITRPGDFTAEQGKVEYVDTGAPSPLNISVLQESFVDTGPDHEDFIILKYTVSNQRATTISNLHVGLFLDWDVNPSDATKDVGRFDNVRQMGYVQDDANAPTVLVATKVLTKNAAISYRNVDNPSEIYDGFTEQEKWSFLSSGVQNPDLGPTDVSQMTGAGPYTIDPGGSIEVAFVILSGKNLTDLQQNADNAQVLWDDILTPVANEEPIEHTLYVSALRPVFPNPAVPPTTFIYDVAKPSHVALSIYDLLGRKVRTFATEFKNSGVHTTLWDGADQAGQRVASGLYLVHMVSQGTSISFSQTQRFVVIR